jgi:ankyrin repeat protein
MMFPHFRRLGKGLRPEARGHLPTSFILYFSGLPRGMERLFDAIRKGDTEAVRRLLANDGKLLHSRDPRGSTPLILAAYYNKGEIVDLLLEQGAKTDEEDGSGNTALMGVCFKGYEAVAKKLIAAGANVNARNAMGATCLIFAITFNKEGIAKLLLEAGADPAARDARGHTALDHARMKGLDDLLTLMINS